MRPDVETMMREMMAASVRPFFVRETESMIEPKMITGDGPQGSPDGLGRGALTARQQAQLTFTSWRLRGTH